VARKMNVQFATGSIGGQAFKPAGHYGDRRLDDTSCLSVDLQSSS
jgi:hypothetical protein